MVYNFQFNRI